MINFRIKVGKKPIEKALNNLKENSQNTNLERSWLKEKNILNLLLNVENNV